MKIYISGGITGCPGYYERFAKAEHLIQQLGQTPINPAAVNSMLPANTDYEDYMKMAFTMLDMADAIYMMPGWKSSMGANREYGYAIAKGLAIIDSEELLHTVCGAYSEEVKA